MIDPIKQFVEQNREAFDDKELPADVLQQIKNRLEANVVKEKKVVPLLSRTKCLVAASVLLAITTTYILINKGNNDINSNQLANKPTQEITKKEAVIEGSTVKQEKQDQTLVRAVPSKRIKTIMKPAENSASEIALTKDLYTNLGDSSSSSVRLSAILEIDRASKMNQNTLDNLFKTLNNDSNSNVRMAALSVMAQYANDEYVSSLLVKSLATQNDPLVQLGLIDLLGKLDNVKVEDRLFALVDDPNTFGAVKDEAYAVLLNQNKL